ncbi:MAG: hypothetical protein KDC35_20250 [Acidobacteria bacterium]|nr:hypothetical protein [Acidobacteriota bacterium]
MIRQDADFRSDTVTKPTQAMLQAMVNADVGDDVYGEDPTVKKLERRCAELTGKEEALFVPSGCMGNLIALMCHARPGQAVLAGKLSHIHQYELGSYARLGGLSMIALNDESGWLDPNELSDRWPGDAYYLPEAGVIAIENTHNVGGGLVYPLDALMELRKLSLERETPIHMDGARIWHASAACNLPLTHWTQHVDSVMMCFSKGMGAPVGSILVGSQSFIERGRIQRKLLGGGMRQAGLLAACCLHALDHEFARLVECHRLCQHVHELLSDVQWMDLTTPPTNILMTRLKEPRAFELEQHLARSGIGVLAFDAHLLRMVFHRDISEKAVDELIGAIRGFVV